MKPTEMNGSGGYKFDTPSTLLSAIKFEDSSDSDSVDSEYEHFTEDSPYTAALLNEDSLNNASDHESDDTIHIKTEKSLTYEGDDFVVKEEPEINDLVIKHELVSSPVVLQPWTIPHTQPSTEVHCFVVKEETEANELVIKDELDISPAVLQPRTISYSQPSTEARAPGTSVEGDSNPAPSDALNVQSRAESEEDPRCEGDLKGLDITNSDLWTETNEADKANETGGQYRSNQYEKSSQETNIRTVEEPYKCKQCEYRGSQPCHVENHMRIHMNLKPYKCEQCEYTAFLSASLQRHIIYKHMGQKSYQCKQCSYRAIRPSHLRDHIRTHTGEKPYQCAQCEFWTSNRRYLRVHMRIHSGEKPYKCILCEYRASARGTLRVHMRIHTGEKPYQCEKCKYMASQLSSLRKHMRKHLFERKTLNMAC